MEFRKLHPDLGAEVIGFDVIDGRDPTDIAALKAAYGEYQFLLFRCDEHIAPERHAEIAGWFGPVVNDGDDMTIMLDNANGTGSGRLPFHSDNTYTDSPPLGISLHAVALPQGGSRTIYVSGIGAWSRLSKDEQERLASMTLQHRYVSQYTERPLEFVARHPLRRLHERTGRPILAIDEAHADRICDLDEQESAALIKDLLEALYRPENIYCHDWQLHDLIVWDNIALQHSRPDIADPAQGSRILQRVTLAEISFRSQIEQALAARAEQDANASDKPAEQHA